MGAIAIARRGDIAAQFSPASLPGFLGWWRADDIAGSDGGAVAAWNERTGTGRNLAQATSGLMPRLRVGGMGGRNCLEWDGSKRFSYVAGSPFFTTAALTAYVVHKRTVNASNSRILALTNSSDPVDYGTQASVVALWQPTASTVMSYRNNAPSVSLGLAGVGVPSVLSVVSDMSVASPTVTNRRDGPSSTTTSNPSTNWSGALNADELWFGTYKASGANMYGSIAEVLLYSAAHTPAQMLAVEKMLGARYGVTIS